MSIAVRDVAKIQSFTLSFGEKKYGIDVLKVGEISGMTDIPPLPGAHLLVGGTVDLKEKTATAADLHLEFQAKGTHAMQSTSVLFLTAEYFEGNHRSRRHYRQNRQGDIRRSAGHRTVPANEISV